MMRVAREPRGNVSIRVRVRPDQLAWLEQHVRETRERRRGTGAPPATRDRILRELIDAAWIDSLKDDHNAVGAVIERARKAGDW